MTQPEFTPTEAFGLAITCVDQLSKGLPCGDSLLTKIYAENGQDAKATLGAWITEQNPGPEATREFVFLCSDRGYDLEI